MAEKTKEIRYWGACCPACQGKGLITATFDSYRVAEEYQDEGPTLLPDKLTRQEALSYVRSRRKQDTGVRYYVIAPNGQIVE